MMPVTIGTSQVINSRPHSGGGKVVLVDRGAGFGTRYVTGLVDEHSLRYNEWYWGHYFDDLDQALKDFWNR
jgi:hypothetical protein